MFLVQSEFVTETYRSIVGGQISEPELRRHLETLAGGATRSQIVAEMATAPALADRLLREATAAAGSDDEAFVEAAYRATLGREVDDGGRQGNVRGLKLGTSRAAVIDGLLRSDEHVNPIVAAHFEIQSLRALRPSAFRTVPSVDGGEVPVFVVEDAADFDWLEAAITEHGYYEKPGIWGFGIDLDKQLMAELLAAFAPARALELGCSTGAVMQCLLDLGLHCEGVEISKLAIERAFPDVRAAIHSGDLLELDLGREYDLVFGLDVFEHLNPNRLDAALAEMARILSAGGFVFANIPAFGPDPQIGTVFPAFLEVWEADLAARRPFSHLQVDSDGYPLHGHLVWAGADWWVERFAAAGLHREPAIERALHDKYDDFLGRTFPARRAFFVFSSDGRNRAALDAIVDRIRSSPSRVLASGALSRSGPHPWPGDA